MNIYVKLNEIIEYIEQHLEEKIDNKELAKMLGTNEYTFQRVFSIICNVSIAEYIRNRRLSNAGQELFLNNKKVIDMAIKYGYNNATAFSRAFEKFHGIKPSDVKKKPEKLKMYTKIYFSEINEINKNVEYKIVQKEELILYGKNIKTDNINIKTDAPKLYKDINAQYGKPEYGMVEYEDKERTYVKAYWILYSKKIKNLEKKVIPESKWISIRINSQETKDIQEASDIFYKNFLPSCKFTLRNLPEIEYYHNEITDFLIAIES